MDIAEQRGRSVIFERARYPVSTIMVPPILLMKLSRLPIRVGYPVLVRPSYVLGGQRMRIVINDDEVEKAVISL